MKKIIIPTVAVARKGVIEKIKISENLVLGTTIGLVKNTNEDSVGYFLKDNTIRLCIADGHWGKEAAEIIVNHWLGENLEFPANKKDAIIEVQRVEEKLFRSFGKNKMDPDSDFTPEASFVAIQLVNNLLGVISYGDCRMLIAKAGKIKTKLTTKATWLGAFSRLGLRGRLPVERAIEFRRIRMTKGDFLFLFTDGVDQCVYEKDTISFNFIANLSRLTNLDEVFDKLMREIFAHGAQDNASLAILKF